MKRALGCIIARNQQAGNSHGVALHLPWWQLACQRNRHVNINGLVGGNAHALIMLFFLLLLLTRTRKWPRIAVLPSWPDRAENRLRQWPGGGERRLRPSLLPVILRRGVRHQNKEKENRGSSAPRPAQQQRAKNVRPKGRRRAHRRPVVPIANISAFGLSSRMRGEICRCRFMINVSPQWRGNAKWEKWPSKNRRRRHVANGRLALANNGKQKLPEINLYRA